jgi:hypothetical protein
LLGYLPKGYPLAMSKSAFQQALLLSRRGGDK